MSLKPIKECPYCNSIGYKIIRNPNPDLTEDRWIRVPCKKCKGVGFLR